MWCKRPSHSRLQGDQHTKRVPGGGRLAFNIYCSTWQCFQTLYWLFNDKERATRIGEGGNAAHDKRTVVEILKKGLFLVCDKLQMADRSGEISVVEWCDHVKHLWESGGRCDFSWCDECTKLLILLPAWDELRGGENGNADCCFSSCSVTIAAQCPQRNEAGRSLWFAVLPLFLLSCCMCKHFIPRALGVSKKLLTTPPPLSVSMAITVA